MEHQHRPRLYGLLGEFESPNQLIDAAKRTLAARYHRIDTSRNLPVSTEITGYAASALVYLHSLTHDHHYLDRATAAARFLACKAWDRAAAVLPFEIDPPAFTYFFDCGIVVRGLLAVWRACGAEEWPPTAAFIRFWLFPARSRSSGTARVGRARRVATS